MMVVVYSVALAFRGRCALLCSGSDSLMCQCMNKLMFTHYPWFVPFPFTIVDRY